jgi:hypothetical protein
MWRSVWYGVVCGGGGGEKEVNELLVVVYSLSLHAYNVG